MFSFHSSNTSSQNHYPSIALPHLVRFGTSECSAWGGLVDCFTLWGPFFNNKMKKPFSIQRSSTQRGLPKLAGACQGFEEELFTSFKKTSSRRTAHRPAPPSRVAPHGPRKPLLVCERRRQVRSVRLQPASHLPGLLKLRRDEAASRK